MGTNVSSASPPGSPAHSRRFTPRPRLTRGSMLTTIPPQRILEQPADFVPCREAAGPVRSTRPNPPAYHVRMCCLPCLSFYHVLLLSSPGSFSAAIFQRVERNLQI